VNTTTPYEQLIAAKLDQVPVPDMADSIWSGIEMQLDAVADNPDKKTSPRYKGKGWYGFLGITATVTLLCVLWWHYSHKNHAPKNAAPPLKTLLAPKDSSPVRDSGNPIRNIKKKETPAAPVNVEVAPITPEKDTLSLDKIPAQDINLDSLFRQHLPVKIDSSVLQNNKVLFPPIDSTGIKLPGKKPKGVKGITSEDYRLSVKKDSTKKENQ